MKKSMLRMLAAMAAQGTLLGSEEFKAAGLKMSQRGLEAGWLKARRSPEENARRITMAEVKRQRRAERNLRIAGGQVG